MPAKYYKHQEKKEKVVESFVYLRESIMQRIFHLPFPLNSMEILLIFRSQKIRFVTINRPASHTILILLLKLMSHYNLTKDEVSQGFNFHGNKPNDTKATILRISDVLSPFNLIKHITETTHDKRNTLDILITRKSSILANDKVDTLISDHSNILLDLNMKKTECPKMVVKLCKLKKIMIDNLKNNIK